MTDKNEVMITIPLSVYKEAIEEKVKYRQMWLDEKIKRDEAVELLKGRLESNGN